MLESAEKRLNTSSTGWEEQVSMALVVRWGKVNTWNSPEDMHEVTQHPCIPLTSGPKCSIICRSSNIIQTEEMQPK